MDGELGNPLDPEKIDRAISGVCELFDEQGLTLLERWFVSESIELAALNIMGGKLRELCEAIKDADLESLSA